MNLLILAAGFATRLEPRTLETPKQLLPLKDDYYLIDLFWDNLGESVKLFDRKIMITNEKYYSKFLDWSNKKRLGFEIYSDGVNDKNKRIGAVGDFLYVADKAKITGDTVVLSSDYIMPGLDVAAFIKLAKDHNSSATITKEESLEDIKAGSCLLLNNNNQVTKFAEKPTKPFSNLYGVPYYLIKYSDIDLIHQLPAELRDAPGQMIAKLVESSKVYALKYSGDIIHMTTEADYQALVRKAESP